LRGLEKLPLDSRGLIVQYVAYLEKEGYPADTYYPTRLKTLVKRGANLLEPESVKETLGRQKIKEGSNYTTAMPIRLSAK